MSFEENNGNKLNLNCDIDDVLIGSSAYIQKYVEEHTIFKKNILQAIEQFKRNCQHYVNMVVEECDRAYKESRIPCLSHLPNMPFYSHEGGEIDLSTLPDGVKKNLYLEPIRIASRYLQIADSILNQFLERRDMFLELDDMSFGGRKDYDYEEEKQELERFKNSIRDNYSALQRINIFCIKEAKRIIEQAQRDGTSPQYGALVKMDANDIIRTNDQGEDPNYLLYEKPFEDISSCINLHLLDYILEKFTVDENAYSHEVVDYWRIYTADHVDQEVVQALRELMASGKINKLRFVTHHNGLRESKAKERLVKMLFPNSEYIGMRFHSEEHHLSRRGRSSKFDGTKKELARRGEDKGEIFEFNPDEELLLDDSKDNCGNWHENKGQVILFRKLTPAEMATGMETFDFSRIIDIKDLLAAVDEILEKRKQKVKRLEDK